MAGIVWRCVYPRLAQAIRGAQATVSETVTRTTSTNGDAPAAAPIEIPSSRITASQLEALAKRVQTTGERDTIDVEQPFTGKPLGSVPSSTPKDVDPAFERARAAQEQWAQTGFAERKAILLRSHDLIRDRQEEILDLLQLESGKARRHAFEEVLDVAIVARYYANTAEDHLKPRRRAGALPLLTQAWE